MNKMIKNIIVALVFVAAYDIESGEAIHDHSSRYSRFADVTAIYSGLSDFSWNHEMQPLWSLFFIKCGLSKQSPVDLDEEQCAKETPSQECIQYFGYGRPYPLLRFLNDGHSINANALWTIENAPSISGGPMTGTYRLAQLHWHWGSSSDRGSEHTIQGYRFSMEMHLVHYNTIYGNLANAIASGNRNAVAVIGQLINEATKSNVGIARIAGWLGEYIRSGKIDSEAFLPLNEFFLHINATGNFYHYEGSLTTPPCDQVVQWIIPSTTIDISTSDAIGDLQIFDWVGWASTCEQLP